MALSDLKSASITSMDADPQGRPTAGKGAAAVMVQAEDYITVVASDDANSIYRLVRIPTNAIVKNVILHNAAHAGSAAGHVGLYYANSAREVGAGKTPGAVIDADFFGSSIAVASASASAGVDVTHEGGFYTLDERQMPIWQAAGLTSDPGGKFDVCFTVSVNMDDAGLLGLVVKYITP